MRITSQPLAKYALVFGFLASNLVFAHPAAAQFHLPIPGMGKKDKNQPTSQPPDSTPPPAPPNAGGRGRGRGAAAPNPPGVPVPPDSPIFQAFEKLGQQSVYHQRMNVQSTDPQMQQMMEQMGFMPAETITAGSVKQVSMHFKMPFDGVPQDFELRAVSNNGRVAKKWFSPAKDAILAKQDAQIASQLAQSEAQSASTITKSLAMGPMGIASAAVSAAGAAASAAEAAKASKMAHNFWEWTCQDGPQGSKDAAQGRPAPPPLTDLRVVGDDTVNDVAVTTYEFYVHDGGQFHGPIQMFVAKSTGLPMRIGMSDTGAGATMQMDYFGYNQGGDFEVPSCLAQK